jgi:hypothetical protein
MEEPMRIDFLPDYGVVRDVQHRAIIRAKDGIYERPEDMDFNFDLLFDEDLGGYFYDPQELDEAVEKWLKEKRP